MNDSISEGAMALSLMLEALSLLDAPEHREAAVRLSGAIDKLTTDIRRTPSPALSRDANDRGGPKV